MFKRRPFLIPLFIIGIVLLFDQIFKIWVKTHMTLGQEIPVFGNWFILHFTENKGMAFGMEFFGDTGKLILSIFRVVTVAAIGYYLFHLLRQKTAPIILACFALIIAGALGNILDSAFYGIIFNESSFFEVAKAFPEEGGYAPFLYGKVVDMLYFPIINIDKMSAPAWIPDFLFDGDGHLVFFRPIFNIADSAITVGMALLLIFYKKLTKLPVEEKVEG